ncbi:MAG: adenylyltransferase/cytidyltransferase family protein [Candidatus Yanofskybacteria bacterium]|nr:adenylyltransferase/cytidyltransferase family protein [Candidatus Yanofskybacteria bacterium]
MPDKKSTYDGKKIVVVSGGFDPIHVGHIKMLREAKKLGDKLVVVLNNDNWLKKKKTHVFMNQREREDILRSIKWVDDVVVTSHPRNPKDISISKEILRIKPDIFAKGGRRNKDVPEAEACKKVGCKIIFNVGPGGNFKYSSKLLDKYVNKVKPVRKINVPKVLGELKIVFGESKIKFPEKLRIRTSEIILNLMNRKKGFGLFVVLGWRGKWNKYTDMPDMKQDIYKKHHQNLLTHYHGHKHDIETTINFDGAILVDQHGVIVHSGIMIEGLRPKEIAHKVNPGKFNDLSEQFGFKTKVHLRHLSAISASYVFKGTTVFTVSEENNIFHVFENGKIIYSL